jgi:hypothetical protein
MKPKIAFRKHFCYLGRSHGLPALRHFCHYPIPKKLPNTNSHQQVHVWLPPVTPFATVILSLCAMSPVLYAVWTTRCPRRTFVPALIYCSHCAFLFGYHVHEKAALTTLVGYAHHSKLPRHGGGGYWIDSVTSHTFCLILNACTHFLVLHS